MTTGFVARMRALLARRDAWLALVVVALGLALRIPGLSAWWLNPDEGIYYSMTAWSGWSGFWAEVSDNAHPPLYYLLLRALAAWTPDFVWYRGLALLAGCAAIGATWLLGRELAGRGARGSLTGLLAALLLALSPQAIVLSQLMRPYMLQLAGLQLGLFFAARHLRERRPALLALAFPGLLIALLTHYSTLLVLAALGLVQLGTLLAGRLSRRELAQLAVFHAALVGVALALFLLHVQPHMLAERPRLVGHALTVEGMRAWLAPYLIGSPLQVWHNLLGFVAYVSGAHLAGAAVVLLLGGCLWALRERRFLLVGLTVSTLAVAILAATLRQYPFGCTRHASFALGIAVLPMAYGLAAALLARRLRWLWLALVVVLALESLPLGRLLGTSRARTVPVPEQLVPRRDMAVAEAALRTRSREPGAIVMAGETYYTLLPLFARARETARFAGDGTFFWFHWGARTVIVAVGWRFEPHQRDQPAGLRSLVARAEREIPGLALGEGRRVHLVFSGWSVAMAKLLLRENQALPASARAISRALVAPSLASFDYDLAR